MKNGDHVLVYSSETGKVRGDKSERLKPLAPSDGIVRLRRETKGRGGGTVIVVTGIPLEEKPLKELAAALKKRCGCGGTVKNGVIEIQGDHRDLLIEELQKRGYRAKPSGG